MFVIVLASIGACREGKTDVVATPPAFTLVSRAEPNAAATKVLVVSDLDQATLRGLSGVGPTDARWPAALSVVVDGDATPVSDDARSVPIVTVSRSSATETTHLPAVIGRYAVNGDRLEFTPRFPFVAGVSYVVRLDRGSLATLAGRRAVHDDVVTTRVGLPAATRARTTRVVAVNPPGAQLPENLLRWYVVFSAPMAPGAALEHVHLVDDAGREVPGAFLETSEELWDPDRRRLTLLFDPGRVKRGIRTNLEEGPPLAAGRRYRLVIDAGWRDGEGAGLVSGYERAFEAVAADRTSPDPGTWKLAAPVAATRAPLRVSFGETLDHALAARLITVHDGAGRRLPGAVTLDDDGHWSFVPNEPWRAGSHELHVDAALEDVAGNSVARVFDADRGAGAPSAESSEARGASRIVPFNVPNSRGESAR